MVQLSYKYFLYRSWPEKLNECSQPRIKTDCFSVLKYINIPTSTTTSTAVRPLPTTTNYLLWCGGRWYSVLAGVPYFPWERERQEGSVLVIISWRVLKGSGLCWMLTWLVCPDLFVRLGGLCLLSQPGWGILLLLTGFPNQPNVSMIYHLWPIIVLH